MPTTSFLPVEVANQCFSYVHEPWVNQSSLIRNIFVTFVDGAFSEMAFIHLNLNVNLANRPPLFIHIHHTFDAEGNRLPFRRIDYIHALYTWIIRVMETDTTDTEGYYSVLSMLLSQVETTLEPARDWRPAQCILLEGPVYMNGGGEH